MSDTLNANASGAGSLDSFIPEVWADTSLEVLRSQLVLGRLITKSSAKSGTFNAQGDTLNISVPGTFTTNSKTAGSGVTLQNPSSSSVNVTLSSHEEVSFVIEDAAQAQANQELIQLHTRQAIVALAEKIETDLSGLYSGFSTLVGTPGAAAGRSSFLSIRQALNTNKAPMPGRFVVVSPAGETDVLGDSALKEYWANARPEGVSEGSIGRVDGFDVYMSQLVPASGAGATSIAGTPEFGIMAMRNLPTNRAPGVRQASQTDPASGLTLRVTASYDTDLLGVKVTVDALYGWAEMRDACGVAFAHAKS